jgi:hypothetical protein
VRNRNSIFKCGHCAAANSKPLQPSHGKTDRAAVLRARAAKYRQLVETSFDPRVILTVEACSRELEQEAALIENCEQAARDNIWETAASRYSAPVRAQIGGALYR